MEMIKKIVHLKFKDQESLKNEVCILFVYLTSTVIIS